MTDLSALTEDEYHRRPELSASGAKVLIQEGGPAKYRWMMDHPSVTKKAFDLGHVAHTLALGVGAKPVVVEGNRNANTVKERIAEVRAEGNIPVTAAEFETVTAMADALRRHETAGKFFTHPDRVVEEIILWEHDGTPWRGKLDLRIGRVVVDYKTSADASPAGFRKVWGKFGYHIQAVAYQMAVESLGYTDPRFYLIVQETTPPYLVGLYEPTANSLVEGRAAVALAETRYRAGVDSGHWPGYSTKVLPIDLPPFHAFVEETS